MPVVRRSSRLELTDDYSRAALLFLTQRTWCVLDVCHGARTAQVMRSVIESAQLLTY